MGRRAKRQSWAPVKTYKMIGANPNALALHNACGISLGAEWQRGYRGATPYCELGEKIYYSSPLGILHFFTLNKPGQLLSARFMEVVSRGPHALDATELTNLGPLYAMTSDSQLSLRSGQMTTIEERPSAILDGEFQTMPPCGPSTYYRVRTVLVMEAGAAKFAGLEFACDGASFETNVPQFQNLLTQMRWEDLFR